MFADGVIGNKGILEVLGCLTGAVYNYMRKEGTPASKLEDIIPRAYDYIYPPLSEQDKKQQVNQALLSYMKMAPGAPQNLFEG